LGGVGGAGRRISTEGGGGGAQQERDARLLPGRAAVQQLLPLLGRSLPWAGSSACPHPRACPAARAAPSQASSAANHGMVQNNPDFSAEDAAVVGRSSGPCRGASPRRAASRASAWDCSLLPAGACGRLASAAGAPRPGGWLFVPSPPAPHPTPSPTPCPASLPAGAPSNRLDGGAGGHRGGRAAAAGGLAGGAVATPARREGGRGRAELGLAQGGGGCCGRPAVCMLHAQSATVYTMYKLRPCCCPQRPSHSFLYHCAAWSPAGWAAGFVVRFSLCCAVGADAALSFTLHLGCGTRSHEAAALSSQELSVQQRL
jgi:hypothetical protein